MQQTSPVRLGSTLRMCVLQRVVYGGKAVLAMKQQYMTPQRIWCDRRHLQICTPGAYRGAFALQFW